ncbi:MAG: DUF2804 domain-containing protein [Ruminococcaceae bacterium]|nr:DUF2804 domain-containing protein [Oscillospiraceae bacterium]
MNKNHKITGNGPLLDKDGVLREPGWANSLVFDYAPEMVAKSKRKRLKEWDYYLIMNSEGKYALSFTFADNRYMGLVCCTVFDFETKEKFDCTEVQLMPNGKMNLPLTSETGDISFKSKTCDYHIDRTQDGRRLYCKYDKCFNHTELEADVFLTQPPMDTMVIATPWREDKKSFYYNQKITCMNASGYVKVKGRTYTFDASRDFGILDWGRGVWTYDNTWFWGIGCGYVDGKPFGYNIGYGFGDTSNASENMIFYDGKCRKLDLVDFGMPDTNPMDEWKLTSNDNRWNMTFKPFFNDHTNISAGVICEKADKLFGVLNGTVTLDDGTVLKIENVIGFHEKVHHKW